MQPESSPPTRTAVRIPTLAAAGGVRSTVAAFVGALVLGGVVIAALGADPIAAYGAIVSGSLGGTSQIGETLRATTPLVLTGIAAAIPFSARLWNVGGEGQFYAGAIAAILVALTFSSLQPALLTVLALVAGVLAGSFWASIAGVLRAFVNANEVIVTLMLNFIAILAAAYVITGPWAQGLSPKTENVPAGVDLPRIWQGAGVGVAELLAVAAAVVAYILMTRTSLGFAIRAAGSSVHAARLAGFSVRRVTVSSFALAGCFAGLGGAITVVAVQRALIDNISENYGFIGIAVALIARLDPLWILPAAFFFGTVTVGSQNLTAAAGISAAMASVIIALFVILLLAFGAVKLKYPEEH